MTDSHHPLIYCPVCSSSQRTRYLTHETADLDYCSECELVWWTTPPTRLSIKQYFQNEYITDKQRLEDKFIHYRSDAIKLIASTVLGTIRSSSARLIDVGTASGIFLKEINSRGMNNIAGIEPSSFAAESVRNQFGFTVYQGFVEDQPLESESIDVITCLDTLCLVAEPHIDISEFGRLLVPGGSCFIELPGFNYRMLKGTGLLGKLLYGRQLGIQLSVHTLYFRQQSLEKLFEQHGFVLHNTVPIPGPVYGSPTSKAIKRASHSLLSMLYSISRGRLNLAPKILFEFRKIT